MSSTYSTQLRHQIHPSQNQDHHFSNSITMSSTQTTTKNEAFSGDVTFKARTGMGGFFAGDDASAVYEAAERLTGPVATPLVEHAGLTKNVTRPIQVLDMACGTGVVSAHLHQALKTMGLETQNNVHLTCADISESQIGYVRQRIQTQGWKNTVAVQTNAEVSSLGLVRLGET